MASLTELVVKDRKTKLHLVLCSFPAFGHIRPLLLLAERLAYRGHIVTVVLSESIIETCKPFCRHDDVRFVGVKDGLKQEAEEIVGKSAAANRKAKAAKAPEKVHPVEQAARSMLAPLVALLRAMAASATDAVPAPDCVVCDHLTWAGGQAAVAVGLPCVIHAPWPLAMLERAGVSGGGAFALLEYLRQHQGMSPERRPFLCVALITQRANIEKVCRSPKGNYGKRLQRRSRGVCHRKRPSWSPSNHQSVQSLPSGATILFPLARRNPTNRPQQN
ncbi:unnamed protein product [Phaeothamnion confervicola]